MKTKIFSSLMLASILLCGCKSTSNTKFTEYHGNEVFQGTGGDEESVDGIDFWTNGDPNRRYQILGVIGQSTKGHSHIPLGPLSRLSHLFPVTGTSDDINSANAKIAREQGGDAVVIVVRDEPSATSSSSSDYDDEDLSANEHHRQTKTLVVVKYVE
jgi:hypothetical protein